MSKRQQYYFVFLICSILIYELAHFPTLQKAGWSPLPAVINYPADQMLYLNLSAIQYDSPSEVVNPWYGNPVPAVDVPHLRFPITFLLFRVTRAIFRSWTLAMLVWAGAWAGLTFAAAAFCLRSIFPDSDPRLTVLAAFGLLVLQSPLVYLIHLLHLPSLAGFHELRLPYMRFAFPQVIVPVVFAYLGLQIRALRSGSKWDLAGMALLQFAACSAFPYVLPIIAAATAITFLIIQWNKKQIVLRWPTLVTFAAVCGALDIGYLLLAGLAGSHGNIQFGLHFRPEMIIPLGPALRSASFHRSRLSAGFPGSSCRQGHGCGNGPIERLVCLFRCVLSCNEHNRRPRQLHSRPYHMATSHCHTLAMGQKA